MTVAAAFVPSRGAVARLATERRLAAGAFALVGLHVVDDAFLQPEPGVSALDHLPGGLVLLAIVVAAAAAYPRLRAGARGALALAFGFAGLVGATEAGYYSLNGGPSGDDFTGLLSGIAGIVLVVIGTTTLWRSRRTDGSRWWRVLRPAGIALAVVVLLGTLGFPATIGYVVTHTARAGVATPALGAAHEEVAFTTSDGLRLHGWFVPSRNGAVVIAFPGRSGPQKHTRMLVRNGYGVLLFDRRGEGASDGDPNTFGWTGDRDLHAALAYLGTRADVDPRRIGGLGLSVGGEMLLHAAAHSNGFRAVVSEGASGQSLRDALANGESPDELVAMTAVTAATALFSSTLPPPSLESEVPRIAHPVFFVYGENGQGGTEEGPNRSFHARASEPKQLWEVPGGQHIAGITTEPREYERRVVGFFDEYLLQKGATR